MRLTMILTAVSLCLTACAGSGNGSSDSSQAPTPSIGQPPPTQSGSQQTDYSKVTCSTVDECSSACDVAYPMVTEVFIRQSICGAIAGNLGPNSATCDAIVALNQPNIQSNLTCRQQMTTAIIKLKSIGSADCSANSGCAKYCNDLYVPTTDQAIENAAAAKGTLNSGTTLKALLANDIVKIELTACLAAPANFVIPALN